MLKPKDVDSYIANSDSEAIPKLMEIRKLIKSTIPKAEEAISWGVPFYKYLGNLVGISTSKNHVSFGLGASELKSEDRKMLEQKGYKTGKRTIQIKFDQKVPTTILKQIIKTQAKLNEGKKGIK